MEACNLISLLPLALLKKQSKPIGGKRRITTLDPEKGCLCNLQTWEHEGEVLCDRQRNEGRREVRYMDIGLQHGIKRARYSGEKVGEGKKDSGLMGHQIQAVCLGQVENLSRESCEGSIL
jgi:hypothetical protein